MARARTSKDYVRTFRHAGDTRRICFHAWHADFLHPRHTRVGNVAEVKTGVSPVPRTRPQRVLPLCCAANLGQIRKRFHSWIKRCCVQILLNSQQLVVLGNTVGAGGRAGLDLSGIQSDDQVGDRRILSLTATV